MMDKLILGRIKNIVLETTKLSITDADIDISAPLFNGAILDSMGFIIVINKIEDEFGIDLPVDKLIPENFSTIKKIYQLVYTIMDA